MPRPLLIFSQSGYLIQIVVINLHTWWQTVQIQISWLLQKPTDLDLHCLQNRIYPGSAGQGLSSTCADSFARNWLWISIRFNFKVLAPVAKWIGELTLNPLGFSPLRFEPRSGHMWKSQVLLTDGQVVFPLGSPVFASLWWTRGLI